MQIISSILIKLPFLEIDKVVDFKICKLRSNRAKIEYVADCIDTEEVEIRIEEAGIEIAKVDQRSVIMDLWRKLTSTDNGDMLLETCTIACNTQQRNDNNFWHRYATNKCNLK